MRGPHNFLRLIRTVATFERTGAMYVVLEGFGAPTSLRILVRALGWPFKWLGLKGDPDLPPVTRALTALGPSYIKFGQILSTRPDIVGDEMSLQLKYLQDQLPPFPTEVAKVIVQSELGLPVEAMFDDFSEPVAAASIAQVHKARLREDGRQVAVKVLRPGIERAFRKDIDAFYLAAGTIEVFLPSTRRLRPTEVVAHFEGVVLGELDLRLEAASASEFIANTAEDMGFQAPPPIWRLSGRSVMTMDWAEGISLADNPALDAAGHDRVVLGARVLQLFLSHALRDGFFHADMHQGNLKVAANGDIIAYDFGIMGRIDAYTRKVYAEILMGFIQRNYRRVAEVHFEAGYVPADRDVEAFASALRAVGEPIFGMEANRISMARLLAYLFEVTERFGMETRTELILLQRTMVVVEGVARSLDENINIWQVAGPVVEGYIRSHVGPVAFAKDLVSTFQVLARFGPKLPRLMENMLIAQAEGPKPQPPRRAVPALWAAIGGVVLVALGVWAGFWVR
jgi:ubiquinone biosynthesis protein